MEKGCLICCSCGKEVKLASEEPPCKVLSGWLMVCHWGGLKSVERYNFCSLSCLRRWVDTRVPEIPEVFLKSLGEEKPKSNKTNE